MSLLECPREIRDRIYDFAFQDPNGLSIVRGERGIYFGWLNAGHGHANTLQYVNHQLYAETCGLECHNTIHFRDIPGLNAVAQCAKVISACPSAKSTLFKNIYLRISEEQFDKELRTSNFGMIQRFCYAREVNVRIHLPYWSQTKPNFMSDGLSLSAVVRKDRALIEAFAGPEKTEIFLCYLQPKEKPKPPLRFQKLREFAAMALFVLQWKAHCILHLPIRKMSNLDSTDFNLELKTPKNYRFVPFEEQFNEELFMESCKRSEFVQAWRHCNDDYLCTIAKSFFTCGI